LIGRQLGDNFGDFFDFHVAQYSTAGRINLRPPMSALGQKQTSRLLECPPYPQERTYRYSSGTRTWSAQSKA
jgi:hypothetical protein